MIKVKFNLVNHKEGDMGLKAPITSLGTLMLVSAGGAIPGAS
jgi:hypothetical protein